MLYFCIKIVQMAELNKNFRIVAKTFAGLEKVLAKEIEGVGGSNLRVLQRAIEFDGNTEVLYKANYLCRSAIRFIKPIATFTAENENVLYEEVKKINWSKYLDVSSTFSIDGHTSYSNITHSKYLALKSKDAIVDQFREETGKRPSIEKFNPDLRINVRIFKNNCTVSLDSSGESLHKRGYRKETGPAPLNEVLAAGMILITGWEGESNFIDPMCGSGTLPIEAAMIAKNIPAGIFRESYAFMMWNDFDNELWDKIKTEAQEKTKPLKAKIIASDRSGRILQVTRSNIEGANLKEDISVGMDFFEDSTPPAGPGVMVTNPPYGERIKPDDINRLYKDMGDALKARYKGYAAWIISSHIDALKHIGLRSTVKVKLFNGPLECQYLKFDMYEGSKKDNYGDSVNNQGPVKDKERRRKRLHGNFKSQNPSSNRNSENKRYKRPKR